jgi:hypothetical protein
MTAYCVPKSVEECASGFPPSRTAVRNKKKANQVAWDCSAQSDKRKQAALCAGRYDRRDAPLRGFPNLLGSLLGSLLQVIGKSLFCYRPVFFIRDRYQTVVRM